MKYNVEVESRTPRNKNAAISPFRVVVLSFYKNNSFKDMFSKCVVSLTCHHNMMVDTKTQRFECFVFV
jgi:hypothetical protein